MAKLKPKLLALICSMCFCFCGVGLFSACSNDDDKIHVACTIFPEYDWAKTLASGVDEMQVDLIVRNGADMHSYEYSTRDVMNIISCDVLIMCGGESDEAIEAMLTSRNVNKNMKIINLLEILQENGMAIAEEDEEEEFDEHVWLSLKNVKLFLKHLQKH